MKNFQFINCLILGYFTIFLASCSLYEGIAVPGYIAVTITVVFLAFVAIWFFRRSKR